MLATLATLLAQIYVSPSEAARIQEGGERLGLMVGVFLWTFIIVVVVGGLFVLFGDGGSITVRRCRNNHVMPSGVTSCGLCGSPATR